MAVPIKQPAIPYLDALNFFAPRAGITESRTKADTSSIEAAHQTKEEGDLSIAKSGKRLQYASSGPGMTGSMQPTRPSERHNAPIKINKAVILFSLQFFSKWP